MKMSFLTLLYQCWHKFLRQPDSIVQRLHIGLRESISPKWMLATLLSISALAIAPLPSYSYLAIFDITNCTNPLKPIQIQHQSLLLSQQLQQQIVIQIPKLDRQIQEQFKLFSIPINRRMNLVYVHQGREYWKIKFTYGGYLLNTTDETIYTTQEIFKLKQDFRSIDKIDLAGRTYDTNGSMQQIGPILHDGATEC
jgi:hypothetical protein